MSQASIPQDGTIRQRRRANDRATVRYRCAPATLGKLYVDDDNEFQHAWIENLSETGMAFSMPRPIPSGLRVVIQLRSNTSAVMHELAAHVVHCTVQLQGEWLVGCEFAQPLSPDVLDSLL